MTLVTRELQAVEQALIDVVQTDVQLLHDASRHIIGSGGKRLRPRVLLLSYLAAGGQEPEEVVNMAAAVEMVHTATLVHDDINDHSPTRRGQVAVHARWGRTFALLAGDYLFTKVYELMAPYGSRYNGLMAHACVRLVEGETIQAEAAKAGTIDRESYAAIIKRKTASLFEVSARMGAEMAGAPDEVCETLTQFASRLGMAFQIVDDILDVTGDPATLGKPVGGDLVQGAGAIMANNGNRLQGSAAVAEADADPITQMMAKLRDSGAIELAMMQARELAAEARSGLLRLPASEARDELERLIDLVVERHFRL
jgi:octaprenyl-diphosphate synthase